MIHYLDTSALVKRYVDEPGSRSMLPLFRAGNVATVRIAYAEIAAAIARLCRERAMDETERDEIYERLDPDFASMTVVEVRAALVRRVPDLVKRRPLRGFDAIHLVAALTLRDRGAVITFWAADRVLIEAALAEGLRTKLVD